MHSDIISVEVSYQPIELCKLLKIANMVGGGGEAKIVISEGYVFVNDEVETQKRKKIYHQDIVEFNGEQIQVICFAPISEPIKKEKKSPKLGRENTDKKKKQPSSTKFSSPQATEPKPSKGRRKRISF